MGLKDHLDILDAPDTIAFMDQVQGAGFTLEQQQSLLGIWMLERLGQLKRSFHYSDPVEDTEPGCTPEFARSFEHVDWVDGESVVQAEQTTGEDGFNWRFHRVEDDLDALAADTAKLFACVAELRGQVATALAEVEAQLNVIHSDIAKCCGVGAGPVGGGIVIPRPIPVPQPIPIPEPYPGGFPGGIPGGGVTDPPPFWLYGVQPGTWRIWAGGTPTTQPPISTQPAAAGGAAGQPVDIVLAGMPATYVARDEVLGRHVDVWSTPAGLLLTDIEGGVGGVAFGGERGRYSDPDLARTAGLARWLDGAGKRVQEHFGVRGFTRAQVLEAFGAEDLGGGRTVAPLLADVPAGVRFTNVGAMLDATVEGVAARLTEGRRGALVTAASLGLSARVGDAAKASVRGLAALPDDARAAFEAAGVKSVGQLAAAAPKKLAQALQAAHVPADSGDIAAWQATAATLGKVK